MKKHAKHSKQREDQATLIQRILARYFDTEDDAIANPDVTANPDDFQLTMGLNEFFDTVPGGVGAKQHLERAGTPEIIKEGYDDLLASTNLSSVGGRNIAAKAYSDVRAAGARNPEILANPNTTYSGYAVEMVVPFGTVEGFTPDHSMGFEMFWRDVDDPDDPEPGFGGAGIFWTDLGAERNRSERRIQRHRFVPYGHLGPAGVRVRQAK